ncbi:hypothetical protein MYCTH_2307222 [Thermothelomyces thermophilus ATCC 42464]|uniref:IPT/TIG domain-containing protein n=1 Tax=Thermothelomyces thermophilus (strain ATCC 42464 / BCRC 31852 / DSM 1799) TaxID=573729 RepID=G2QFE4_THET4|nr:uncharacterized protein MYCTH_2307222 [Thermothelomyces thermophilus ATCC 42464]AEO59173.1 hypothetical protein MYCTH_2307222 [Thermothelomyces thermophilus ATCC 42464]
MRYQRRNTSFLLLLLLLLTSPYHGPTTTFALPFENLPASVGITEDTPAQVTINGNPTGNATLGLSEIPVAATLFSGVPGPSACRGSVVFRLALEEPPATAAAAAAAAEEEEEKCYDLPRAAGCGTFSASKEAG